MRDELAQEAWEILRPLPNHTPGRITYHVAVFDGIELRERTRYSAPADATLADVFPDRPDLFVEPYAGRAAS
ncbi:hypothetical protein [Planotetraspora silvatica]|uniref:hypothetical protein n=1 Tax=Planotetraspora silvatica TaxID=234614 RepID=UPI00194E9441|nr:hypothetical protein [Planotetraspora silvatica]